MAIHGPWPPQSCSHRAAASCLSNMEYMEHCTGSFYTVYDGYLTLKLLHASTQYCNNWDVRSNTKFFAVAGDEAQSSWSKRPLVSTIWIAIPFHRHHRSQALWMLCSDPRCLHVFLFFLFIVFNLYSTPVMSHRSASLLTAQHSSNPSSLYPFIVRLKEK